MACSSITGRGKLDNLLRIKWVRYRVKRGLDLLEVAIVDWSSGIPKQVDVLFVPVAWLTMPIPTVLVEMAKAHELHEQRKQPDLLDILDQTK